MGVGEMPKGGLLPGVCGAFVHVIYENHGRSGFVRRLVTFRGVGVAISPPAPRGKLDDWKINWRQTLPKNSWSRRIKAHVEGKGGCLPARFAWKCDGEENATASWSKCAVKMV